MSTPSLNVYNTWWYGKDYVFVTLVTGHVRVHRVEQFELAEEYFKPDQVPQWIADAIAKLRIMEPEHRPIEGLGQRRTEDCYRVLLSAKGDAKDNT